MHPPYPQKDRAATPGEGRGAVEEDRGERYTPWRCETGVIVGLGCPHVNLILETTMARGQSLDWWKFYPGDFFADTDVELMSGPERGAYLILLARCFHLRAVIADPEGELARQGYAEADAARLWAALKHLWDECEGGWTHHRVQADYVASRAKRETAIANGTKGGRPRKNPGENQQPKPTGITNEGGPDGKLSQHSALSTQTPSSKTPPTPPTGGKRAAARGVISEYPRYFESPEARTAWEEWVDFKGARYTAKSARKQLTILDKAGMTPARFVERVDQSIAGGWKGIPPDDRQNGRASGPTTASERLAAIRATYPESQPPQPRTVEVERVAPRPEPDR